MLGSDCSCCDQPACYPCGVDGEMPATVTVELHNIEVRSDDLIAITVEACFGSGASLRATDPHGAAANAGPLSTVVIDEGGSGYAALGRIEPPVEASSSPGSGATFAVTLSAETDECGRDYWAVSSVTATGGSGYEDGQAVSFAITPDEEAEPGVYTDVVADAAVAVLRTEITEPTLVATAPVGNDAEFSIAYTKISTSPERYEVSAITVVDGGTAYDDGSPLDFSLYSDGNLGTAPVAYAITGHTEPTLAVSNIISTSGADADLSVTMSANEWSSPSTWGVSAIGINDGGSGYEVGDEIVLSVTDGQIAPDGTLYGSTAANTAGAVVDAVDGSGAITAVSIWNAGQYFKSDGIIASVWIEYHGYLWRDTGEPTAVEISHGGVYYREDTTAEPYVATPTITVAQTAGGGIVDYDPEGASGAELEAEVDDDPQSPTFGQIVGVNVTTGGDGYLAWGFEDGPLRWFSGKTFVLEPDESQPCRYIKSCDGCKNWSLYIEYRPGLATTLLTDDEYPSIVLMSSAPSRYDEVNTGCLKSTRLRGDKPVYYCETLKAQDGTDVSYTVTQAENPIAGPQLLVDGAYAVVTPGGDVGDSDDLACVEITQEQMNALTISVDFAGRTVTFPLEDAPALWGVCDEENAGEFGGVRDEAPCLDATRTCIAWYQSCDFVLGNRRYSWIVNVTLRTPSVGTPNCQPKLSLYVVAAYNEHDATGAHVAGSPQVVDNAATEINGYLVDIKSGSPAGSFTVGSATITIAGPP